MEFDLAIIGAGPGGYVAALRAAKLGAKVALIEKDEIGGTCLNRGCIPTKALAASAHALPPLCKGGTPPYKGGEMFKRAQSRKDQIVIELRNGVTQLLKAAGVETVKGSAAFTEPARITVDDSPIDAKKIIISTGSSWCVPPGLKLDGKFIVSSDEALAWTEVPQSLLIVGGGVIGCEFASIYHAFGSKITIVEAMPSILPTVERSISRLLAKSFKDRGIEILTDATVQSAEVKRDSVSVRLSSGQEKMTDKVLVCVGRRPNIPPLCKGRLGGVDLPPPTPPYKGGEFELTDRGAIKVNEKYETNVPNVYAIGDVIGGWMLAHVASAQGTLCVEQMFRNPPSPPFFKGGQGKFSAVPLPIFTSPEIASVGFTSEELTAKNISFKTGRFPYMASGKARCDGETEGMAIVHVDEKGQILGAHFFGKDATILVAEATLAVKHRLTAHDIGATIHAHPTLPEIFAEAAMDAVGEAIHKAYRK